MSTINIEETKLDSVVLRLTAMSDAVKAALERTASEEAMRLEGRVTRDKLSGQVLGQKTRRLVRAIHSHRVETGPDAVQYAVGVEASDESFSYARFWEYGFSGTEQVKAYFRTSKIDPIGRAGGPLRPTIFHDPGFVQAHNRRVDQPARSYLRSTLAEDADGIRARLLAAGQGAMR